ncbi:MAG: hypothetical protein CMH70_00120 [Nitrosomonadaceae bacterium]|nr:hypothetical protein [Nitrosomonadaceae bacterium]
MDNVISFSKLTLGCLLLAIVIALPSGITAWFDGLPWTGEKETIALTIIIPFLFILAWRFLALRLPILLLGALLILKIVLFLGSPAGGWLVKVYPSANYDSSVLSSFQRHEGDTWVTTYETSWNENASGILRQPWTEKLDFPLDWVLFSNTAACGVSTIPCFNKLNPVIEIEGSVLIPEGKRFSLVAEGVQKGTLSAIHESGESFILTPTKDIKEGSEKQYQLPRSGRWRVSGKLHYGGTEWSLIPLLVEDDGEIETELGRGVLWKSEESLSSAESQIGIYKFISFVIDIGIIVFLILWAAWATRLMIHRQILTLPLVVFSTSAICISIFMAPVFAYMLQRVGLADPTSASYLGISILISGIGYLLWVYWAKDFRNFRADQIVLSVFLLFGPPLLLFFANLWCSILGQWAVWGAGDDWTSYQFFARKIVVEGEWLNAGEGVFIMQPLYRYFVGFYHWLFGQSAFVQHMADVWCVLGATVLLASWAVKLRLSALIILIANTIYLAIILMGTIRYHIGRGLIEHHAMIFMVLAGWFLYGAREGNFLRIVGAGICGVIGYWLRQDHLIVIAMLVFFIIEPTHGATAEVWKAYWSQIWTYWKRGFSYVGIIVSGVFLICFRNWWVGGVFAPAVGPGGPDMPPVYFSTEIDVTDLYMKMKLMLTATHSPTPSFATMVLLPGTFIGFAALIWRPNCLRGFPMAIGCALIGVFLPYVFFSNPGYPGRYSIHLLPLALLSTMIITDYLLKRVSFFEIRVDEE